MSKCGHGRRVSMAPSASATRREGTQEGVVFGEKPLYDRRCGSGEKRRQNKSEARALPNRGSISWNSWGRTVQESWVERFQII